MKKSIALGLFAVIGSPIFADDQDVLRSQPDVMAITTAMMGIASQLLTTLPSLIKDIAHFPALAQADAILLENEMKVAAQLVGDAKQKKIEQLFVDGVNLTILVANILNKLIVLISSIGPLAEAIDPDNGAKIDSALQLTAIIMQMISKINVAMKNSIIAGGQVAISDQAKVTPEIDPIPDL